MGDRVLITFVDSQGDYSPAIYMHWGGEAAPDWIREAQPLMRFDDASYAAARFCGFCHTKLSSYATGLGLVEGPRVKEGDVTIDWDAYSHGDAGVYIVHVGSGLVEAKGGYGEEFQLDPDKFGRG